MALVVLGCFAFGIETFAVLTGLPYGHFSYSDRIGVLVFGLVPWTVPFAWTPLLLVSYTLAERIFKNPLTIILGSALLLVAIDLVLDPAAVGQKFWAWSQPGPYYGVPYINFFGWLLSGLVGSYIFQRFLKAARASTIDSDAVTPPGLISSGFLILVFWTSVCFWMEYWLPASIGVALTSITAFHLFSAITRHLNEVRNEHI